MRFLLRLLLLFTGFLSISETVFAQGSTSKGTEFYTTWMDHRNGAGTTGNGSQMNLYLTSDVNTSGQVELVDGTFTQAFTVTANQVTTVAVPTNAFLGSLTGLAAGKGIHITSVLPIAVYAHIYASAVSGATLLLPVSTLGKDYVSINYTQIDPTNGPKPPYSTFDIIATDDNTSVQITPTATLTGGQAAGTPFTITLAKKGDVYQCQSQTDLTGSHIKSVSVDNNVCKPIAVFSGSSKITIERTTSGDNLFQQVYPTSSWGKNFITVPLSGRDHDIFRVIVTDPNTNITGLPVPVTPAILANGYVEFTSNAPLHITADKQIQIVQYAITQTPNSADRGDPEMIFLNPIEQGLNHVTLFSTSQYAITKCYINVSIPQTAVSSFLLDGQPYNGFTNIAGSNFAYAQITVPNGVAHNISAAQNFNAIAYGFGNVESYGYSAGTNLADFSKFITLQSPATGPVTAEGCSDISYQLSITLPFSINSIIWNFNDGTAPVVEPVSPSAPFVNNGVTEYRYDFATTKQFAAGPHTITASYVNPTVDCGQENFSYQVTIADPPKASFSFSKVCFGDATAFQYTGTADTTNTYKWNFGDGGSATGAAPTHSFASGDYTVVLTVTNSAGCSTTSQQAVHISKKPVASFTNSSPDCGSIPITFTNTTAFPEGIYGASAWDFGDGTAVVTDKNPVHSFTTPGTYHIKLTVTNDKGCTSDLIQQDIVIHSTPAASFTDPDVCLADITATFTSTSTIDDGTEAAFTYLWDFGDGSTLTTLAKTVTHSYSSVGSFNVKLTVVSSNGCQSPMVTNPLIVNKSDPKSAAYVLITAPPLCSANAVIIQDASEAQAGDVISSIQINWGDGVTETYLRANMHSDKMYTHSYGLFSGPITKTYTITETAFTGGACFKSFSMPVVINANPVITLNAPAQICQEAGVVNIIEVKNGFSGNGVFSGTGVTSSGIFDPAKSGPGTFILNYVFTSDVTGCLFTTTQQIIVNPTPVAHAGPDHTFLQGAEVVLEATASTTSAANTLKYKWTPATGLDHDDILDPIASPVNNTLYTLTVTSVPDGCSASSTTNVYVLKSPVIPNTFTPNNDGINDVWTIQYLDSYKDATVDVYSRNGEKVFSSVGYSIPWDGKYNGNDLPSGVYYYIVNPKHGQKILSGYVTILK